MRTIKDNEIQQYVDGLTDLQRDIVLAFRNAVLTSDNRIKEGIKWGSIAFFNKKNICGFRVAKAHVTLLFMEGADLNDTHNILQGTGAKARTCKVTGVSEINVKAISNLVKQSLQKGF